MSLTVNEYFETINGHSLYVKNVFIDKDAPALIMLHGSSYPAHVVYDISVPDYNIIDYYANLGYNVFCVDMVGFGKSSMPDWIKPTKFSTIDVIDILRDFVARINHRQVVFMGKCWGAVVGMMLSQQVKIDALVLLNPVCNLPNPADPLPTIPTGRAYFIKSSTDIIQRWSKSIPANKLAEVVTPEVQADVERKLATMDKTLSEGRYRAPAFTHYDMVAYKQSNGSQLDISKIDTPTFVLAADYDYRKPYAEEVYRRLTAKKAMLTVESSHWAIVEQHRKLIHRSIHAFIHEHL